jgi:hypothetical protein
MRSEILRAESIKGTVFWDITPCSLVDRYSNASEESDTFIFKVEESFDVNTSLKSVRGSKTHAWGSSAETCASRKVLISQSPITAGESAYGDK